MTDLTPPADRVICRQLPPDEETAFGLVIPEVAREKPLRAEVLAVGEGTPHPTSGVPVPLGQYLNLGEDYTAEGEPDGDAWWLERIAPGDVVVLPPYGGTEIDWEGETVISILGSEILARVG